MQTGGTRSDRKQETDRREKERERATRERKRKTRNTHGDKSPKEEDPTSNPREVTEWAAPFLSNQLLGIALFASSSAHGRIDRQIG